jgi:hypothetical protein
LALPTSSVCVETCLLDLIPPSSGKLTSNSNSKVSFMGGEEGGAIFSFQSIGLQLTPFHLDVLLTTNYSHPR